jgi:hypothetical protein
LLAEGENFYDAVASAESLVDDARFDRSLKQVLMAGLQRADPNGYRASKRVCADEGVGAAARSKQTVLSERVRAHAFRSQIWAENASARTARASARACLLSSPAQPTAHGLIFPLPLDRRVPPAQTPTLEMDAAAATTTAASASATLASSTTTEQLV